LRPYLPLTRLTRKSEGGVYYVAMNATGKNRVQNAGEHEVLKNHEDFSRTDGKNL